MLEAAFVFRSLRGRLRRPEMLATGHFAEMTNKACFNLKNRANEG